MPAKMRPFASEKERADRILAEVELPAEVKGISIDFGKDESGDEALFVRLHLAKDVVRRRSDIKKLAELTARLQILLMGNGITHFPYVFLDEAA